jgi:xanthosine utilization system XapX-like protein
MLLYLYAMMQHLIPMPCLHLVLLMLMVGIYLGTIILFLMRLGRHQLDQQCFIKHVMLHLYCYAKNDKVVARSLGPKCKRDKTCIWVPKSIVTNC